MTGTGTGTNHRDKKLLGPGPGLVPVPVPEPVPVLVPKRSLLTTLPLVYLELCHILHPPKGQGYRGFH